MTVPIALAEDQLKERTLAVLGERPWSPEGLIESDQSLLLIGMDVDEEDLNWTASKRCFPMLAAIAAERVEPPAGLGTCWADGFLVGKLHAAIVYAHDAAPAPEAPAGPPPNPNIALNPAVLQAIRRKVRLVLVDMTNEGAEPKTNEGRNHLAQVTVAVTDTVLEELVRQGGRPC